MTPDELRLYLQAANTPVGGPWPIGAWVYTPLLTHGAKILEWLEVYHATTQWKRQPSELSELEANERGIFRTKVTADPVKRS